MFWCRRLAIGAVSIAPVEACDFLSVLRCSALCFQNLLSRLLPHSVELIRCPALQAKHVYCDLALCNQVLSFWLVRKVHPAPHANGLAKPAMLTTMCLASSFAFSSVRYPLSAEAPADALLLALPRLGCDSVCCVHSLSLSRC